MKEFTKKEISTWRSNLRSRNNGTVFKMTNPLYNLYKKSLIVQKPIGKTKRLINSILCAGCDKYYRVSEIELDHIERCGEFTNLQELRVFYKKLFCDPWEGLQPLCKECHGVKTYTERYNCTEDEAKEKKFVIKILAKYKNRVKDLKFFLDLFELPTNNNQVRKNSILELKKIMDIRITKAIEKAMENIIDGEDFEFLTVMVEASDYDIRSPFLEDEIKATLENIFYEFY